MKDVATVSEQPPPPEPGTYDAHPPLTKLEGDADTVRRLASSIHEHNGGFSQVEEYADGMMHILLLDADTGALHVFHMSLAEGMQLGTYCTETFRNASPATRQKLMVDFTDRRFADDEARRARQLDHAKKHPQAEPPPAAKVAPPEKPLTTKEKLLTAAKVLLGG